MGPWKRNRPIIHLPKAFLVDMDDTLITFSAAGDGAWRAVCTKYASQVNGVTGAGQLLAAISAAGHQYWGDPERHRAGRLNLLMARREVVALALTALGEANNPLADRIADEYSVLQYDLLDWFAGAEQTLEQLRRDRVRLVLVTNGQAFLQRAKINRFHLDRYFEAILIEDEMGFGKPDPRVYRKALTGLALSAKDVRMIGDNLLWDVKGAQDAGMEAIWVDFRGSGLPEGSLVVPDRILLSFSGLYG